jgi:ATP-dependent DNA helicase RecG
MRKRIYNFVKDENKKGRQAYVVCPLVEESDLLDAESAIETAENLKNEFFQELSVGLLHGKMKPAQKDEIMLSFKKGTIDVLVSTTVIEVGINVPNATVMIVENADRFGLAQLHQLRGRVGRSEHKSYCILVSEMKTDISKKRMKIMHDIGDGFKIAEKDLELRGTGEFFGTNQHGLTELKLADIFNDINILKLTNELAKELLSTGNIFDKEHETLRLKIQKKLNQNSEMIAMN